MTSHHRTARPRGARFLAGVALIALTLFAGARPASAHAELLKTSPAAGDQLATSPAEITLTFNEAVELPEVRLLDALGSEQKVGELTKPDDSTIAVALPTLDNGGYVVAWKAISSDGHPISGAFTFAVGNGPLPDPSVANGGPVVSGKWAIGLDVARSVQYTGLVLSLGLWAFVVLCWWDGRAQRSVRRLVVLGAAALIVGSLGRIFLQAGYIDAPISRILRTDVGRAWATTAVLALPIGLLATGLARLLDRRVHAIALVVLGVLAGRSIASGGHGASGRAPLLGNALTVVHVAAASLWIGGLVGVILCVRRREDAAAERAVRRFSTVALCTVALLAITGTLQGIRQLDTFDALTGSPYGKLLIIKVAVIGVLLAVAALSRFALRAGEIVLQAEGDDARRWPWQQVLGRTVAVELLVAAIVIGITGTLAGASPLVSASTGPVNLALLQGDRTAYISVFPAKAGDNAIHITIDEPSITGPDEVTVELTPSDGRTGAIAVPVVNAGPGHVIADNAVIPFPGQWTIKVDARYGEFELVTFTGDFKVG